VVSPMGVGITQKAIPNAIQNACQCDACQELCRRPCWGTPEEIWSLIQAGFGGKLEEDHWRMDCKRDVIVLRPRLLETGYCVFFQDGKCELHDLGLKPLEGVITHCSNPAGDSGRGVFGKDTAQHWDARSRLAYEWSQMGARTRRLIIRTWERALGLKKKPGPKKKLGLIDQWV
jgi:hypothetical protein